MGVSRFSVENFSSHSAENFRGAILYCCINSGKRKGLDRKGRELQGIPSNIFCLTVPKNFVGESFTVALISGSEKVYGQQGGRGVSRFFVEISLSLSPENFRRGILYCCSNVGYRKCLHKKWEYQGFPSEYFCATVPKFFVGGSFVAIILGTEKVWIRGVGNIMIFRRTIFVSQCRKFS